MITVFILLDLEYNGHEAILGVFRSYSKAILAQTQYRNLQADNDVHVSETKVIERKIE